MNLLLIVLLPFLGAMLPPLLIRAGRGACAMGTAAVTVLALALLMAQVPAVMRGEVLTSGWDWLPALGLNAQFMLDGLGLLFASLILGIGLLIIVYARYYLSKDDPMGAFYSYLLLFQGAMVGIVLSDNILLLLVFWELTSLSSFLLIGFWKHLPDGRRGARMALTVTGAGGLAMVAGMLLIGEAAGTYQLSALLQERELIQSSPLYLPGLMLILLGCFTKSAQFPFHFWLPHAMAAPTPVSAYLHSATMVKAGLFLLARMWPVLSGTDAWMVFVTAAGLVTMVMGAWIALFKDDLKGLLAFSTVSHLGLITMLFGLSTPMAAVAAVFHIINHATFKAALFMNAGIVDHETGTRDIRRLGGLAVMMPVSATLAMVAAASMAGVPLFNGFLSKEMMLEEVAHTNALMALVVTVGALFSVAYSARYVMHVYFGRRPEAFPSSPHDPPAGMWLPSALLVTLVVLIGLFPETMAGAIVRVAAGAVTGGDLPEFHLALWHGLTPALFMSLVALGGGLFALSRYARVRAFWQQLPHPDARQMFEWSTERLVAAGRSLTYGLHNGSLPRYLSMIVAAFVVVGVVAFAGATHAPGERAMLAAEPVAIVAWLLLMGTCVLCARFYRQRLIAVVTMGVAGLIVSLSFVYLSAPDLALTQITVEVGSVILILLALYFLPKDDVAMPKPAHKLRAAILAGAAGLAMGAVSFAMMTRDGASLSEYYLANSVPGGGGANVVNVILVDFRGFDTFGEIIVLGIAGLAIFALLDGALRGRVARRLDRWQPDQPKSLDRHPVLMVVATRVMLPLAMLVGVFIFLRGHNAPGGGFIAGLVVSIALIMQYMASGFGWAAQRVKFDYHALIGCGVLTAAATGIGAMVADRPFLTSTFGHLHLPLIGDIELASAMAFDTGVFLAVVGAVMLALANLSRLGRRVAHLPVNVSPMDYQPPAREEQH